MSNKTQQLQIRLTPKQKEALRRHARAAGLDLSTFVLTRVLPRADTRFAKLLRTLGDEDKRQFAFAELNDFLEACAPMEFPEAVGVADVTGLPQWVGNYVAAMVEQAAARKRVSSPAWVGDIEPLKEPYFATPLRSLRMHLIRVTPLVFKRRNIFIDASVGSRV
jgi:uncharacterized protein (DUF1778 family)